MKAIIIVDIPDERLDGWVADYMEIFKYDTNGVYDVVEYMDVQLQPIPEKYSCDADDFIFGWNACIDEILKEGEDAEEE